MPAKTRTAKRASEPRKFPIACKTWQEAEEIKRRYLKPVRFGPKGQPIYDHDEVARYVVFPAEK
jgi:hypothetical protein